MEIQKTKYFSLLFCKALNFSIMPNYCHKCLSHLFPVESNVDLLVNLVGWDSPFPSPCHPLSLFSYLLLSPLSFSFQFCVGIKRGAGHSCQESKSTSFRGLPQLSRGLFFPKSVSCSSFQPLNILSLQSSQRSPIHISASEFCLYVKH